MKYTWSSLYHFDTSQFLNINMITEFHKYLLYDYRKINNFLKCLLKDYKKLKGL